MPPTQYLLIALAGAVAGFFGALFGIGGGLFIVPVLAIVFHVPMHEAVATSIVTVIATSTATAAVYVERGTTNIRLGMTLETVTVVGALVGSLFATSISARALELVFASFLTAMGGMLWYRARLYGEGNIGAVPDARIRGSYFDESEGRTIEYGVRRLRAGMGASFVAGLFSGLLGVGGGIVKVPVMNVVCGVPIKAATATSNFMIGVTASAGAIIFFLGGYVHPYNTAAAALGVLGGSMYGTRISARIRSRTLLALFIGIVLLTAIRMFFG